MQKNSKEHHQQTAHCENLAKLAKPCETKNLIAKPCETCICETLRKLVFVKLAKHDLPKLAKHCETLIAKIANVAKIE